MKASRFIPSAHKLSHDAPSRRRRPRSLARIGQFPPYAQSPSTTNRQNKRYAFHPVSALAKATPAPLFSSGRADNACTNLLGYLVRCVRTRDSMRLRGAQNRRLSLCPLPHSLATHYFLRLTRARGGSFLRGRKALLNDFWYFSSQKSTIKEKFLYFKDNTSSVSLWLTPSAPVSASPRRGNFALCGVRPPLSVDDTAF